MSAEETKFAIMKIQERVARRILLEATPPCKVDEIQKLECGIVDTSHNICSIALLGEKRRRMRCRRRLVVCAIREMTYNKN